MFPLLQSAACQDPVGLFGWQANSTHSNTCINFSKEKKSCILGFVSLCLACVCPPYLSISGISCACVCMSAECVLMWVKLVSLALHNCDLSAVFNSLRGWADWAAKRGTQQMAQFPAEEAEERGISFTSPSDLWNTSSLWQAFSQGEGGKVGKRKQKKGSNYPELILSES